MKTNNNLLYNKSTSAAFQYLAETVQDIFEEYIGVVWSTKHSLEFGFYEKDKKTRTSIFLGIWYEAWGHFEMPLCIAIDYAGSSPIAKHQEIRRFLEKKNIGGIVFKDYQDLAVILFDHSFFNFHDDQERISKIFKQVSEFLLPENNREFV